MATFPVKVPPEEFYNTARSLESVVLDRPLTFENVVLHTARISDFVI